MTMALQLWPEVARDIKWRPPAFRRAGVNVSMQFACRTVCAAADPRRSRYLTIFASHCNLDGKELIMVKDQAKGGKYGNASNDVRDLIRKDQNRQNKIAQFQNKIAQF